MKAIETDSPMAILIMTERRRFLRSAAAGLFGLSMFSGKPALGNNRSDKSADAQGLYYRYPAIHDEGSYGVVNAAHTDLNKVKELVTARPELAGAAWDWGYGDYETALGAASHMGRRDIAEFLIAYGARPDIFTFAMMGMLKSVQEIIETFPGIQGHRGPHGITLLKHAQNRFNYKDITAEDKTNVGKVISYLEAVGGANIPAPSIALSEEEKRLFSGDYRFGTGETEIFTVATSNFDTSNLRIVRKGLPGRIMFKVDENTFSPTGAPSVKIVFDRVEGQVVSLTIHEPQPVVKAVRI